MIAATGPYVKNSINFSINAFFFPFQTVFSLAPFPYRKVVELREKYTYDIHPFSTFGKDNSDERSNGRQGILTFFFTEIFYGIDL